MGKRLRKNEDFDEKIPPAYVVGLITFVIMALMGLYLSVAIVDMNASAWGFSGFFSFAVAFRGGPFWLASGIACLISMRKAVRYRTELLLLGLLNILGVGFTAFSPLLYRAMLLVWFFYYGFMFWLLWYLAKKRVNGGKNERIVAEKIDSESEQLDTIEQPEIEQVIKPEKPLTETEKLVRKALVWKVVVVAVGVVLMVIFCAGIIDYSMGAGAVRRQWRQTALAKSSVFKVKEDASRRASNERLYLKIEGVDAEVSYYCRADYICWYEYSPRLEDGHNSLGMYFWQKNAARIEQIIEKYDQKLNQCSSGQIDVYDEAVIDDFIKDVLTIPDIKKLYAAYKEQHDSEYSDVFLDLKEEGKEERRIVMFKRAEELGL